MGFLWSSGWDLKSPSLLGSVQCYPRESRDRVTPRVTPPSRSPTVCPSLVFKLLERNGNEEL